MAYYNTTNLTQPELALHWDNNLKVDEMIKNIFRNYPSGLTAFEVFNKLESFGYKYPLWSVRRSITDIMNEGYLVLTDDKRAGGYGRMNKVYKKK